jgi:hypothetical protein
MNLSAPFIKRPVATALITIGIAIAGALAFLKLPVSPLPQVDLPTIAVAAQLPSASPDTVATSVASPLERRLGQIADVTEMTSTSSLGQTQITLQFGLNRDIDGAARDVQAAINAARADLPTALPTNPNYHKYNPADSPVLILALTSKTLTRGQIHEQRLRISAKNDLAIAINYGLSRWPAFTRFLDDGRVCLSNNAAERTVRGIAVGRRNWTFAGSDAGGRRAATMYTLIETCKLNDVDPQAWLADVLARLPDHPAKRIDDLLPWAWKSARQITQEAVAA